MDFQLSERSLSRLEGVQEPLVQVVKQAITTTTVDFGVICGMRTEAEQKVLFDKGASKTMKSKHLEGKAVDLMAYIDGRGTWELNVYDEIADAMKAAAKLHDVKIRWGAAWTVHSLGDYDGTSEDAMMEYIDIRRAEGKRPFIDAPHFELV